MKPTNLLLTAHVEPILDLMQFGGDGIFHLQRWDVLRLVSQATVDISSVDSRNFNPHVLDFPFAPVGRQRTYRGKREILAYMRATPGRVSIDGVDKIRFFAMHDPEIAVAELTVKGHIPATGAPYNQSYVLFFEARRGKLWRYREYWNPLVSIDAMGGEREDWASGFGSPAPEGIST